MCTRGCCECDASGSQDYRDLLAGGSSALRGYTTRRKYRKQNEDLLAAVDELDSYVDRGEEVLYLHRLAHHCANLA
ncbi:hypothetical protein L596_019181 [Steinernema carpocapsae]|uniref:Uncharacterized protein n=1 Tax=Steinernema carpocapsae TaxID=34508 RepID=A0A4U5N9A5_STECR|nr:hypothetical protein L596_019181 [Steinernema carpocapsae]